MSAKLQVLPNNLQKENEMKNCPYLKHHLFRHTKSSLNFTNISLKAPLQLFSLEAILSMPTVKRFPAVYGLKRFCSLPLLLRGAIFHAKPMRRKNYKHWPLCIATAPATASSSRVDSWIQAERKEWASKIINMLKIEERGGKKKQIGVMPPKKTIQTNQGEVDES